ncbi:MAG: methionyl-tRNA formyltransferase [Gemmatimonadota bacterium]
MRIVFWGTPTFAVPSLRALLGEGHDVVGVVTQPDRPAGRGRKLRASPVKVEAVEQGIPVLQPERARGEPFMADLSALQPELSVVVAYGQILRPEVLEVPALGSVNVHASLLPELRGAAPVNWSIIRGYDTTGITVMRMIEAMDAGPILFQVPEPIGEWETATDLAARLSEVAAATLVEALALMEVGALDEEPQDDDAATYAPRLHRDLAHIDWQRTANEVSCWVRGLDEVPGGWTLLDGQDLKVYRPLAAPDHSHHAEPGTVLECRADRPDEGMLVACGAGAVWVREVKPAGRRRMRTADWLLGRGARPGDRLK